MSRGEIIFDEIYGKYSAEFKKNARSNAPGKNDKALFYAYENFFSQHESLELRTRMLITIASLVSQGKMRDLRQFVLGALNVGCRPVEISETIQQMGIYVGEPKADEAMEIFLGVVDEIKLDIAEEYDRENTSVKKLSTGDEIFKRLFGEEKAGNVYTFLKKLSPGLEGYAIDNPFGEYYAKEHLLDLKIRELITIASLVTSGMLPQLELHIGAALYIGCSLIQIEQVILQMGAYAGNPPMLNAMKIFSGIKEAMQESGLDGGLKNK